MIDYGAIAPHARVRIGQSYIGTVEGLEGVDDAADNRGMMIVLSDDGNFRYRIPLSLVANIEEDTFPVASMVIDLKLAPEELTTYVIDASEAPDVVGTAPALSATRADAMTDTKYTTAEGDDVRVPLRAEELTANTEPTQLGHVRVHKGVESREERFFVPVQQEQAVIERIPPDQYDGRGPRNENEVIVPLMEERLVVQKQLVVKEYLRIYKEQVSKQLEVRGKVRHEVAHVTEEPTAEADAASGPLFRVDSADDASSSQLGAR